MGPFDISGEKARQLIAHGGNPNGRSNADVIVPFANALDTVRRPRDRFIVDFGVGTTESEAAQYEAPFELLSEVVRPTRKKYGADSWWLHWRPRAEMRRAIAGLRRFIATPAVAKYRLFVWVSRPTHPDHALIVIAREDDYAFGVLHSRAHELWSLRMGTWLGKGNDPRYTPTTTFETFPFPWPLNTPDDALSPEQCARRDAIAEAARALDEDRRRWLNPPEWVREEPDVVPSLPPRFVPVDEEAEKQLKQRTLTNLYNQRPSWLQHRHAALDRAVFEAFGWTEALEEFDEETILARLLALNLERAAGQRANG